MDAADRRLAVSWSPVDGATGYKVAARLKNGVEPFEWSEYAADSSPYVVPDRWAAMSGLEYEVRTASVNAEGQSVWSASVAVTAPELPRAPAGALETETSGPYAVGDLMRASLRSQRPIDRKSLFVWSVCDPEGQECELLPIVEPSSYLYLVPWAARGKRVQVQTDYDKDGLSYTATIALGVVSLTGSTFPQVDMPPGCERAAPSASVNAFTPEPPLSTLLHYVGSESVQIDWDGVGGGASEPLCNDLLVATPWGRMALVRANGKVEQLEGQVPMNLEGLREHPDSSTFAPSRFRVADILLKQRSNYLWDLFVTHHYFTGDCTRFRLSSTMVAMENGNPIVSPSWRTLFDADPCLDSPAHSGYHSGGKMLTDGAEHLLVVIGDHGWLNTGGDTPGGRALWAPQDPGSHLGKLVRVEIASGETEILAFGLRNPQGFARDAEGNLWETEHGPQGGDELNLLEPGLNYGWPSASYGIPYGGYVMASEVDAVGEHEGFVKPRFAWATAIGVSAMVVNDKRWFPLWRDDLLIGSLGSDETGRSLFRVRLDGTRAQYVERIPVGGRVRDIAQMPDGRIALLIDGGTVRFLSRSSEPCADRTEERLRQRLPVYAIGCDALAAFEANQADSTDENAGGAYISQDPSSLANGANSAEGKPASGAQLYMTNCEICHSLVANQHGIGPHLANLVGRRIGEVDGWNSSGALRSLDGVWTRDSLARFLADPQAFAPGTTMGSQGLSESEARAIADYVAGLRGE